MKSRLSFFFALSCGISLTISADQITLKNGDRVSGKIVTSDDMKKRLLDAGGDPVASTPEDYAQNIQREEDKWLAVIKKLGLVIKN